MIKQLLKKVLIIYLVVIACVFTPTYRAYAASAGGWAFSAYDVATSIVTALKGSASASVAVAKSPISQKIAKGIVGGVIAGAALPLAISQISGIALEALDWVLDPANNQIKYKDKNPAAPAPGADCGGKIIITGYGSPYEFASFADALADISTRSGYSLGSPIRPGVYPVGYGAVLYCETVIQPQNDYKTIPIPTVADKIYDNAKTDSESRSIVNDAVKEYVNEGSADVALDAAKADADATHNCGTGTHWSGSACVADTTTTPDTPTTDTPFDPTSIIDAIGKVFDAVMTLPDVINTALDDLLVDIKDFFQPVIDSFTDFVDWVKQEPTTESPTQPDITPLPMPQTDSVDISFDGGCPAPNVIPWSLAGQNVDMTISYTPICDTATLLNPIIKLAASLGAVFIIAGIRRGDDG
ncbi:hypothetical protein E6P75_05970 [Moraxella osloensis]|uniref:Uncharacterized protein n=1 Tax=Faucicola osloensis TaxID=34062 RepID=A0AAW6TCS1_FAUOS|nr:virulence factor TspB C-terminal domain-related protein [Moraxella osloensis]MDI4509758.1 hypothetical protein [Moraxella osloensis]